MAMQRAYDLQMHSHAIVGTDQLGPSYNQNCHIGTQCIAPSLHQFAPASQSLMGSTKEIYLCSCRSR